MVHFDGQSPSGFTSSNYDGWRADGGSVDVVENPLPIDVAAFVDLMNVEFQATALARVGFEGLTLDETKDFIVNGYAHYGLADTDCSFLDPNYVGMRFTNQDADGNNLLNKTEFLLTAKFLITDVNSNC